MDENLPELYEHFEAATYSKQEFDEYSEETFYDVWENCALESIYSLYNPVYKAIILNVIFGLVTTIGLPQKLFHCFSALCGVYLLLCSIQTTTGLLVIFSSTLLSYCAIFLLLSRSQNIDLASNRFCNASVIQYTLILMFVLFEYLILEKDVWLEIRGIMMVFSMKLISIAADLSTFPSFLQYCGYIFSCGNILFGPWISYEHYIMQSEFPTRKNLSWICAIARAGACAIAFLTISNCWTSYFIPETSNSLISGYKEALTFRTSHYFVCYLSEALMLAAGWKDMNYHFDDTYWRFSITNFMSIEFPSCLATVVVNWNKPMHEFLKKYIYKKHYPSGKFKALLLTFVISALFHGLELKVSTVLISLGVFSYLQIFVREYIAQAFDICVKIHPCKLCSHSIKRDSIICRLTLLMFSLFTVLHLIFLGVLMDPSTDEVGIYYKWDELYFCSLWIMFLNFLLVK